MSILQLILAAIANWFGRRQGVAEEAARQTQERTQAENTALRWRAAIDRQVEAMPPDQLRRELNNRWSRD